MSRQKLTVAPVKTLPSREAISKIRDALALASLKSSDTRPILEREKIAMGTITYYLEKERFSLNDVTVSVVDKESTKSTPPLLVAISNCSENMVLFLLAMGADPNQPSPANKVLPLEIALREFKPNIVKALLEKGANPNFRFINNTTPLIQTLYSNDQESAIAILEHPKSRDIVNLSPGFHIGVNLLALSIMKNLLSVETSLLKHKNFDMSGFVDFQLRLELRANPDFAAEISDRTYSIVGRASEPNFVEITLDNIKGQEKKYLEYFKKPLLISPRQALTFVKEILENSVAHKSNILIYSAFNSAINATKDPDCKSQAMEFLRVLCGGEAGIVKPIEAVKFAATLFKSRKIISSGDDNEELLIRELGTLFEAGLNPESTKEEMSLLDMAVRHSSANVVKFLASKVSEDQLARFLEATPLHLATTDNNIEKLKILISLGGDANKENEFKETPLLTSIVSRQDIVAKYLVSLPKVDVNTVASGVLTPLVCALLYNRTEAVKALLARSDLKFEHLAKAFTSVEAFKTPSVVASPSRLTLEDKLSSIINDYLKKSEILERIKSFDIPETCSLEQRLEFAKEIKSINLETAIKHFERISESTQEGLDLVIHEATSLLVEEYQKLTVQKGYQPLLKALLKARVQSVEKMKILIQDLPLVEAITEYERELGAKLGKALDEIKAIRQKVESDKPKQKIPSKKTFEEFLNISKIIRNLPDAEITDREKYLLKLSDSVRISSLNKVFALAQEKSVLDAFKSPAKNIEAIKKSFLKINKTFKIISEGLDKQDIQNIEILFGKSLIPVIMKYSTALQNSSAIEVVSELEAFKMFGTMPAKSPALASGGLVPSKPVVRSEEEGGAAAGAPVASASTKS